MSEIKKGGKKEATLIVLGALGLSCVILVLFAGLLLVQMWFAHNPPTETKTLTILHAWGEGGQYYFADELGCVYHMACKIRYDDMPKIRFEKLKVGHRYHIEYVLRQGNVRLSLNEKEGEIEIITPKPEEITKGWEVSNDN